MQLRLHADATTTPRTRAYIQHNRTSNVAPACAFGTLEQDTKRLKKR